MKPFGALLLLLLWMPALTAQNGPETLLVKARLPFRARALAFDGDTWRWAASGEKKTIVAKLGRIRKDFDRRAWFSRLQFRDRGRLLDVGATTYKIASGASSEVYLPGDYYWRANIIRIASASDPDFAVCYWQFSPGKPGRADTYLPDEMTLIQLDSNNVVRTYTRPGGWPGELELACGGPYFAMACTADTLDLWDWRTGTRLQKQYTSHGFFTPLMAFSSDSKLLALRDASGVLQVLDLPDLAPRAALEGELAQSITQLAWEPDGSALLFIGKGMGLMRWHPSSDQPPRLYYPGEYKAMAISPQGDKLLLGSATEVILLARE